MATKIYVGNLSFQTGEMDLKEQFSQYGEVLSAAIVTDRDTGQSRGFGFVEMNSDEDARKAIDALNDFELDGRNLKVNEARPREDRRPRR